LPQTNGANSLKKLDALAAEWIAESKLPENDTLRRARYLESKLATSGLFKYSLEGQVRDSTMDPIEDFLTVHRAGHCEYFATALTLMLRSQHIHARIVTGFKCDEWHETGQCYQVRQLHAHAWVEAWLPPNEIPDEMLHGKGYWPWKNGGGWLRLDPTPARDDEAKNGVFAPIGKALQWLDFAWSIYVVEMNYERQRKAIFTPIAETVKKAVDTLRNPKTWRELYDRIGEALHRSGAAGALAWLLLILTIAASLVFFGLIGYLFWRLGRKLWRTLSARRGRRRRGPRIEVEFYRRLEHLFKKSGLVRPLGQTPREFALVAGEWLAAETGQRRLLPLPARIVEAYYHVRFGRLALDSEQSQEVEQILRDMELRIADRNRQIK
jgi:protein-glutamine gamma-glutamyltransferase